jgi:hypothetical protein
MKRRKGMAWLIGSVAVILTMVVVVAVATRGESPRKILAEPRQPNGDIMANQAERLLRCVEHDLLGELGRLGPMPRASRLLQMWHALYPRRHTREMLTAEGFAASRPLLQVVLDPKAKVSPKTLALCIVADQDPYGTLNALLSQ